MIRTIARAVFAWACTPVLYLMMIPFFILMEWLVDGDYRIIRDVLTAHWRWATFGKFSEE